MDELSRTWKYDCTAKRMGDMNKTGNCGSTPCERIDQNWKMQEYITWPLKIMDKTE